MMLKGLLQKSAKKSLPYFLKIQSKRRNKMDFLERWESKSPEERQSALQSEEQTLADDPRGSVAATDTQKAILTQEIESAPVSPYTLNFSYSITGPVAIDRIKRAVEDTLLSHPILNTRYLFKEDCLVSEYLFPAPIQLVETTTLEESLQKIVDVPINPKVGPCTNVFLLYGPGIENLLLLVKTHHLVTDGQSMDQFAREIVNRYNEVQPERVSQFRGLVREGILPAKKEAPKEVIDWWRNRLGSAEPSLFPVKPEESSQGRFKGSHLIFSIDGQTWNAALAFVSKFGAGPSMLVTLAVAAVHGRYSGIWDSVFGMSVSGRSTTAFDSVIGPFADSKPMRVALEPSDSTTKALQHIVDFSRHEMPVHEIPFSTLVRELRVPRVSGLNPLYNVLITMDAARQEPLDLEGGARLVMKPLLNETARVPVPVPVQITVGGSVDAGITLRVDFSSSMYSTEFMEQVGLDLVQAMADIPKDLPISDLGRRESFSELSTEGTSEAPDVLELFYRWSSLTPDKAATIKGNLSLTYLQLSERIENIRNQLKKMNARTAVVSAEYGPDLVVALLGCLAAGVEYVPVSDNLSADRVEKIKLQIEPDVDITSQQGDLSLTPVVKASKTEPDKTQSEGLAYAMFTSGSTGEPKSVWISRKALARHVAAASQAGFVEQDDCILALTSPTFDISLDELLLPLTQGATVVFPAGGHGLKGVKDAASVINRSEVSVVHGTPSMMETLIAERWGEGSDIRRVIVGGERLDATNAWKSSSDAESDTTIGTKPAREIATARTTTSK
jgi:hypothetical protein